ncbi:MAG: Ig-like domain-containing protein [Acidobacteria bacterium]|nr:Ig-like domain-containing protein [Acidobacteriota bacterium]MBV9144664.1 Ig-like domain-containing protein [Acidobacteriota bacterium]MBV9434899.1 Ig-like domain-containing protein [Acidobacteriota bacterium]
MTRKSRTYLLSIFLVVLSVILAAGCGKFFPSASTLVAISITPSNPTIQLSATQQFTATGTFGDSTSKDLTSSVTWKSSSTNVATISSTGLATAQSTGSSTITAAQGNISGVTTLTVSTSGGGSLTISCSGCISQGSGTFTASLSTGSVTFSATNNGSAVNPTWTSSNTGVASIGSTTGIATLLSAGTTTISASANGASGSITLTVQ